MSSKDQPAFPQSCADALDAGMVHAGMTLRDYFAAKAMQSFVAMAPDAEDRTKQSGIAAWSYQIADAMMKARDAK